MAQIFRVQTQLLGFPGAPGVNSHYFTTGDPITGDPFQGAADELHAMMTSVMPYLYNGLSWAMNPEVFVYDIATGNLDFVDTIDVGSLTGTGGGSTGTVSRASMIKVRLSTGTVVNNRRLRGGVYLGPVAGQAFTTAGGIASTAIQAITTGYSGMISGAGPKLQVWHRPSRNGSDGQAGDVTGVSAMPLPAVLRSRRD